MRAVVAALGGYKSLSSGRLAPALGRARPVHHTGFDLTLSVSEVTRVAEDVISLRLIASDGAQLPRWRPGAHLDVFLPSGRQRQYSLCGDPRNRHAYRIAVRLIRDGGGGSREIHQRLRAGDPLRIRGPRNAFRLVEAESYHFVAGGIGITPILPMVTAAHARGRRWRLLYTGRTRASMPFLDELADLRSGTLEVRPDDEFGRPAPTRLLAGVSPLDAVYMCGPPPMLDAARAGFGGQPRELHTERFSAPAVTGGTSFPVQLHRSGVTVEVGERESVLAAVRRVLPEVPYSCQQGFCGSCRAGVLAGRVEHRDNRLLARERADSMLLCVSRCDGPLVLDL
jgi:ferredoxin-NADP reductase